MSTKTSTKKPDSKSTKPSSKKPTESKSDKGGSAKRKPAATPVAPPAATAETKTAKPIKIRDVAKSPIKNASGTSLPQIDPLAIYGMRDSLLAAAQSGEPFTLTQHPDFPNPRSEFSAASREIINAIKEAKALQTPVMLYKHQPESGEPVWVVVDGLTRLTGIAECMLEHPDKPYFSMIPFITVDDDEDSVKAQMLGQQVNRAELTNLQIGRWLVRMKEQTGLSSDVLAAMIGRGTGKGAVRFVNEMIKVASDPKLVEAGKAGVSTPTLKGLSQIEDPDKRAEATKQVVEAVKEGKDEKETAVAAGLRRTNRTTMGYEVALDAIMKVYPSAKQAFQRAEMGTPDEEALLVALEPLTDQNAAINAVLSYREKVEDEQAAVSEFFTLMSVVQQGELSKRAMCQWVEGQMSDDDKNHEILVAIGDWLPSEEGDPSAILAD